MTTEQLLDISAGVGIDVAFCYFWWIPKLRQRGYNWGTIVPPLLLLALSKYVWIFHPNAGKILHALALGLIVWLIISGGGGGGRRRKEKEKAPEGPPLHDGISPFPA